MNQTTGADNTGVAEAVVGKPSRFPIIWVVPIVAAVIGAWLVYKAVTEEGPTITITFETAAGLTAGKSKIKFRNVEVGTVEGIDLADDLEHVIVTVKMSPGSKPYLRDGTRFWVVRAQVTAGEVRGLGTLLSGAYIGIAPVAEGRKRKDFVGLETSHTTDWSRRTLSSGTRAASRRA
jgi:paraquat-inducible protein B